jgi:hypothetical protein
MSRSSKKTKYGNGVTTYNEKDEPRTKGMRNPFHEVLRGCKGGAMKDKRTKRSQDARRSFKREEWE